MNKRKQERVLESIPAGGWYTTRELADFSGYGTLTLAYWLRKLVDSGQVSHKKIRSTQENLWRVA
jgi:hypothetical protein